MQSKKKKFVKLKQSKKFKILQKGGANYTMSQYNDGRFPDTSDVYVGTRSDPYPPNLAGGDWYQEENTRDGRYKFRWNWYEDQPTCGDGIARDDRLYCQNSGRTQRDRDNWCMREGWDCARCANSGYCTHMPLDGPSSSFQGFGNAPASDLFGDRSFGGPSSSTRSTSLPFGFAGPSSSTRPTSLPFGFAGPSSTNPFGSPSSSSSPSSSTNPFGSPSSSSSFSNSTNQFGSPSSSSDTGPSSSASERRGRLPCDPVPRTCDDIPMGDGERCLGGKCPACENNEDIEDPISQDIIPIGKGVCIDKQCYDADNLRRALRIKNELPHNRQPFTLDDLDNALQQDICIGGPSSSSDAGLSSSSDVGPSSSSTTQQQIVEQLNEVQARLQSLQPSINQVEQELRGYENIFRLLEVDIENYRQNMVGIISDEQLNRDIDLKNQSLTQIMMKIIELQDQLAVYTRSKEELESSLTALGLSLQDLRVRSGRGGKKYKKIKKTVKRYKNKKRKNTVKRYKNKKRKNTIKRYKNKRRKTTKK